MQEESTSDLGMVRAAVELYLGAGSHFTLFTYRVKVESEHQEFDRARFWPLICCQSRGHVYTNSNAGSVETRFLQDMYDNLPFYNQEHTSTASGIHFCTNGPFLDYVHAMPSLPPSVRSHLLVVPPAVFWLWSVLI